MKVYRYADYRDVVAHCQTPHDALLGPGPWRVLDLGCGGRSHIRVPSGSRLTGVDESADQLARNHDLTEAVRADVTTYPIAESTYDLIICWWLLEHLPSPLSLLERCITGLRPGGLLTVASPNPASVKGLITRALPYRLHVWTYRYLMGVKDAGKNGRAPNPTFIRWCLRPSELQSWARRRGLTPVYLECQESLHQRRLRRWIGPLFGPIARLIKLITFGIIDAEATDYVLVLQKKLEPIIALA